MHCLKALFLQRTEIKRVYASVSQAFNEDARQMFININPSVGYRCILILHDLYFMDFFEICEIDNFAVFGFNQKF